ncbi:Ribulokinase [Pseudochrobactrum sp. MP213Fo]
MRHYIGIDVGTGSARAGLFDCQGRLLGSAACGLETFRPQKGFVQQSSRLIWDAVCTAVKAAVAEAAIAADTIAGLGFDATCSLVVADENGNPVTVSPNGEDDQDVILWMDHRAVADADEITALGGKVLEHVGGRMSPEMELPKIRWFKRELPQSWAQAGSFWELPDWLVHRATATDMRSLCSPVCKWTYMGDKGRAGEGWDKAFLEKIGLVELADDNFAAIGNHFGAAGEAAGRLSEQAAAELGLPAGIAVSTALIDAYSGALGTLAVTDTAGISALEQRLALIAGTSSCHIALSTEPMFVSGVWGPYYSALLPNLWDNEGGQSAAGALIDAVIARHSASHELAAQNRDKHITDLLNDHLADMAEETATLTRHRHVQPDFHGNRSPLAESWRKGAIAGLTLEHDNDDLALDYLATIQALAYGTRHILEEMRHTGLEIDTLVVSGGLARNPLYLREHADITGCRVLVPEQAEPVLLGSAMLGAVASGDFATLPEAMAAMSGKAAVLEPREGDLSGYHDMKYLVYRRMQMDYADYAELMDDMAMLEPDDEPYDDIEE